MPCGRPGVKVKICGLTSADDVAACIDSEVDFVGFNTWSPSPRFVEHEAAVELARALPREIIPVAVCVWSDPMSVQAALSTGFEWIQVHDTPEGWRWNEAEADHTIVRALKVDRLLEPSDLVGAHYYLVDTPGQVGGSGQTFDWGLTDALRKDERLFVAGGLNPHNVAAAIIATAPYAVDVASGVERTPGMKDPEKIDAFVRAVLGE